eukprot:11142561-Alexandrium_andersonii.AAC.1
MGASNASTSHPLHGRPTAVADAASARWSADSSMASKFSNASSFGAGRSTPSVALAGDRGVPECDWAGPVSPAGVLGRPTG